MKKARECIIFAAITGFITVAGACSTPPFVDDLECDPDPLEISPRCRKGGDGGTDADGGAGGAGGAAAFVPPDLDVEGWINPCGAGHCAPIATGQSAGLFDEVPVTLYVGPNSASPIECPPSAPKEKWRLYDDLVAPPATCDACTCEASKGDCSEPPEKIEIRAGTCAENGVAFSPFDGPPNWTGTCSSEGGLSAGAMCGNEPCAQSVWASPLPPPKGDACLSTTSIPLSTKQFTWQTRAIACEAETPTGACTSTTQYCVAEPGPEWATCVYETGIYSLSDCPDEYNAGVYHLYPHTPIDDRGCTECSCGAPMGSACIGYLRTYRDEACSEEGVTLQVGSMGEGCTNVIPQGQGVDSKRVTDLAYLQGTCGPSGGAPKGVASGDTANAITFCCTKAPPAPPPPFPPLK